MSGTGSWMKSTARRSRGSIDMATALAKVADYTVVKLVGQGRPIVFERAAVESPETHQGPLQRPSRAKLQRRTATLVLRFTFPVIAIP